MRRLRPVCILCRRHADLIAEIARHGPISAPVLLLATGRPHFAPAPDIGLRRWLLAPTAARKPPRPACVTADLKPLSLPCSAQGTAVLVPMLCAPAETKGRVLPWPALPHPMADIAAPALADPPRSCLFKPVPAGAGFFIRP